MTLIIQHMPQNDSSSSQCLQHFTSSQPQHEQPNNIKHVHFDDIIIVHDDKLTAHQRKSLWIGAKDLTIIQNGVKDTVMTLLKYHGDTKRLNENEHCLRGLEKIYQVESRYIKDSRRRLIREVLFLQNTMRKIGRVENITDDDNNSSSSSDDNNHEVALEMLSKSLSINARSDAISRALDDEQESRKVFENFNWVELSEPYNNAMIPLFAAFFRLFRFCLVQ